MLKYIITWVVVSMQPTSCPDANKANEFGVKANPFTSCAVMHLQEVKEEHSKTFTSRDSAKAFYNRLYGHNGERFLFWDRVENLQIFIDK
jgi:hypothetical protein